MTGNFLPKKLTFFVLLFLRLVYYIGHEKYRPAAIPGKKEGPADISDNMREQRKE